MSRQKSSIALAVLVVLSNQNLFAQPNLPVQAQQPAARAQQKATRPQTTISAKVRYINREWDFDNVDVSSLTTRLNQIGINLPVRLQGKISGKVKVGVPWGAIMDPRAWKLSGYLTSGSLKIDGRTLENVLADIKYEEGVLSLTRLRVMVPAPVQGAQKAGVMRIDPGELRGSAGMELIPRGHFSAELNATDLPLAALGVESLQPLAGTISGQLTARVPVDDLQNRAAWQITGPVTGKGLTVQKLAAVDGQFDFEFKNDIVTVRRLKASSRSIGLSGGAQVNLADKTKWNIVAQLNANDPQNSGQHLAELLPQTIRQLIRDRFRGEANATVNATGTLTPFSLKADGKFVGTSLRLRIDEAETETPAAEFVLLDRVESDYVLDPAGLTVVNLKAVRAETSVSANGKLKFDDALTWDVDLTGRTNLDLIPAQSKLGGTVDFNGRFVGKLFPWQIVGTGDAAGQSIGIDGYAIDRMTAAFDLDTAALTVSDFQAAAYSGTAQGKFRLPLQPDNDGSLSLTISNVATQQIANRLGLPIKPAGQISGNVEATIPAGHRNDPGGWSMDLSLQIPTIQVKEYQIGEFRLTAKQRDRRLTYTAGGRLFSGKLTVRGERTAPIRVDAIQPPDDQDNSKIGSAEVSLTGVSVRDAVQSFYRRMSDQSVSGTASLKLSLRETKSATDWDGSIELSRTTIGRVELSEGLRGRIRRDRNGIRLEDLTGTLAGGRFQAAVSLDPDRKDGMSFRVSLRSTQLSRLKMLDPTLSELPVSGFADFELTGRSGQLWTARGTAMSGLGRYGSLQFDRVRIPLLLTWSPSTRRLRAETTAFSASVARGRVGGKLTIELSPRLDVRADCKFRDLELARVVRQLAPQHRTARGRVNGTLTLSGQNVRSIREINATLAADLRNTQAFSMPILSGMPALIPGTSATTSFNKGRLEARLNQGVVDVSRLSLSNPQLAVFVDGKLNHTGRLRLNAVVSTASEQNIALAQFLVTRAAAATPAGWILLANDYLSNRTVHIEIHGTARKPILRLKPFESLQAEAARFLIRQLIGAPIPQANGV